MWSIILINYAIYNYASVEIYLKISVYSTRSSEVAKLSLAWSVNYVISECILILLPSVHLCWKDFPPKNYRISYLANAPTAHLSWTLRNLESCDRLAIPGTYTHSKTFSPRHVVLDFLTTLDFAFRSKIVHYHLAFLKCILCECICTWVYVCVCMHICVSQEAIKGC